MQKRTIEKIATELVVPIVEQLGFELVDLEFVKEAQSYYLRIYVDKPGGITIDDCETLSRAAEAQLDTADPVELPYILEISSPGLDRPLKKDADFQKYSGRLVDIKLYKAIGGKKEFQGQLVGLEDGIVTVLDQNGDALQFGRKDIAIIRLAVQI